MDFRWTSDGLRMDVGWTSDGRRMDVALESDELLKSENFSNNA